LIGLVSLLNIRFD